MPTLQIKNTHFYYELHGDREPLILIAGYTSDYGFWLPVLDILSKQFQVLIFDNRGVGRTVDDNGPLTDLLLATDVIEMADKLKMNKPHIVGLSMGGSIAQTIAAHYGDKINKLGLISTSAKWRAASMLAMKNSLELRRQNLSLELLMDNIIPWLFGENFLSHAKNIAAFKQAIVENKYPQSLENQARQYEILVHFDGRENLAKIKNKTLICYGREDLLSLPAEAAYLADKIANAKLLELECGHLPVAEIPHDFANTLIDFLKDKYY